MTKWLQHANGRHAAKWAPNHGRQCEASTTPFVSCLLPPVTAAGSSSASSTVETGPVPRALVTCPKCGVSVRKDRVQKHITEVHKNRPALNDSPVRELLIRNGRILFVKFKWPDRGESIGVVLCRIATHILAAFPHRTDSIEYIWLERPKDHSRVFWDTLYNAPVAQLASTQAGPPATPD